MDKKRLIHIVVVLLFSVIIIALLKNIYLYQSYEHGNVAFIKSKGERGKLKGIWEITIDTWEHGVDERHVMRYNFTTDSTGIFYYDYYINKSNGRSAKLFSWSSILPFDSKDYKAYISNIIVDSLYIAYLPTEESFWQDTVYAKYKLVPDSLFIDSNKYRRHYTDNPKWEFQYSHKPDFYKMFYFWEF
jgi:hypothetical protein